jgi:hypothetical protein
MMRVRHGRVLLTALVGVFLLVPMTASAATVTNEVNSETCTEVIEGFGVSGGCPVAGNSVGDIEISGPFGIMLTCSIFFEGRIGGTGHILGQYGFESCEEGFYQWCSATGERHVEFRVTGDNIAEGVWPIEVEYCVDVRQPLAIGEVDCHLEGRLVQVSHGSQQIELGSNGVPATCEDVPTFGFLGTIDLAADSAHPAVEVDD